MKRVLPLIALALTGCVHTRVITATCVSPEQVQALRDASPEKVRDKLTGKADEDLRTIAANSIRLRSYAEGLLDLLETCSR